MKFAATSFVLGCVTLASTFGDDHCAPHDTCAPQEKVVSAPAQSVVQTPWESVAYPDFCGFNAGVGTSFGLSSYSINAIAGTAEHFKYGSIAAFTVGLDQVVGYRHWFYLQLRENFSKGNTSYGGKSSSGYFPDRLSSSWFFDADARLYIPFRVSPSNRISLQPFGGFAIHQIYLKGGISASEYGDGIRQVLLRQRLLAPLAGLALGYNPSETFALRTSLSYHMPSGKQALPVYTDVETRDYRHLRISRHGMGANFLALARLTPDWTLKGEIDYFYYSVYATRAPSINWVINATSCLSLKCGAVYQF